MKPVIDFYFDVVSPYTYIATQQLPALAERCGAEVRWCPVLVGGLFKLIGHTAPLTLPARAKSNYKDVQRLAKYYEVELHMPKVFPFSSLLAMRCLAALPAEQMAEKATQLFIAQWKDQQDLMKPEVLTALLGAEIVAQAEQEAIKEKLKQNTAELAQRGGFGVPTFFVGEEMFFGQDRLFLLEDHLKRTS